MEHEHEEFEMLEIKNENHNLKNKKKQNKSTIKYVITLIIIICLVFLLILSNKPSPEAKNIEKEKKNLIFLVQDISSSMEEAYKKILVEKSEVNIDSFLLFIEFYSYFNRLDIYTILQGAKSGNLYDSFSLLEEIKSIEKSEIKKRLNEYWKEDIYNTFSDPDKYIKDKLFFYDINIDNFLKQIEFKKKQVLAYYLRENEDKLIDRLYNNLEEQNKNVKEYPFYEFWHWFDKSYKFNFPEELFIDKIQSDIIESIVKDKIHLKNHENIDKHSLKNIYNLLKSIKDKMTIKANDYLNFKNLMSIFKKYLYGDTKLKDALNKIKDIMIPIQNNYKRKIIILITDGKSFTKTERKLIEEIKQKTKSIVVVFYISSKQIENSNKIFINSPKGLNKNENELFKSCSSFESSSNLLLLHLKEKNITIENEINSKEGIKLFFQANDKILMNNLINAINDIFSGSYDFLLNNIGNIELKTYLNNSIDNFGPKSQILSTCYAYASATAIHLTLINREGAEAQLKYPFEEIKNNFINRHGYTGFHGDNIEDLFNPELKKYNLKFKEVDESKARDAIRNKLLCVVTFFDKNIINRKYNKFFKENPKGILTKEKLDKIVVNKANDDNENFGHAVVLIGASGPLKLLNSYGENWGDGGFFRIDKSNVFKEMHYYVIYWDQTNLNDIEKNKIAQKDLSIDYFKNYDKIKELYKDKSKCKLCGKKSFNYEFKGTLKKVECPKCHKFFEPKDEKLKTKIYYDYLIY